MPFFKTFSKTMSRWMGMRPTPVLKSPEIKKVSLSQQAIEDKALGDSMSALSATEKLKARIWLCQEELVFATRVST